jgi:hypothetical protein
LLLETSPSKPSSEATPSPTRDPKLGTSTALLIGSQAGDTKQGPTSALEKGSEIEAPPSPSRKTAGVEASKSGNDATEPKTKTTSVTAPPATSDSKSPPKTARKPVEFDNEDANGDAIGESTEGATADVSIDDVQVEQEDHPFDAPSADSTSNVPEPTRVEISGQLTAEQRKLREDINRCLSYFVEHPETTVRRSPWAVMHAILPFGVEAELSAGNQRVNAIGWMCYNGMCKTQRIFQPTKTGFRTNLGPGVQGHEGQFLAILAQSKVAPTYPLKIGNRTYTVNDLVRLEMATCREKSELTFKLIGLSYYLDHNQRWRDNQGGVWSLEKLVSEELNQPVVGAACGGTHRLMGLTFSLMQHKQAGLPVTGHWYRAEQYINDFVGYALSLQNSDGSFSTEWFETRANEPNVERKVQTTGHILEWLVFTVPDDQLQSPQILKSVHFLLDTIGSDPSRDWPIGPRGHSLRALALYNQRVFGAQPGKMRQFIANTKTESRLR